MVAQVTVKDNSVQVSKAITDIVKKFPQVTKKALARSATFQIRNIRTRTEKGTDVNGRKFAPYSKKAFFFNVGTEGGEPRYKSFQDGYAGFRNYKGRQTAFVDLNFSGRMLSSMTSRVSPSKGELFFSNNEANRKAFYHDVAGAGKSKVVRPFFGISDREEEQIVKVFSDLIDKEIKLWA